MSAALVDEHVKALSKAELAHHIVGEITEPICHILHHAFLIATLIAAIHTRQRRAKLSHMQQHHIFHTLQRSLRKGLAKHTPLAPVNRLINRIVRVVHTLDGRERVVEIGLLEPLAVAVDIVQTAVGVDRDKVRRDTNVRTVLLVESVQPEMAIALEAVVELYPGCDRGPEGTGDAAERVDEAVVEDVGDGLSGSLENNS